jgi:methyl-accepting chemotaxis protein
MKLKTQILALGLAGVAISVLVGAIGFFNASKAASDIEDAIHASGTLQASQEADMMHDAVRADVLLALVGSTNKDNSQLKEAQEGLTVHTETFLKNLAILDKAALSLAATAKVKESVPMVQQYIASGEAVIKLSATNLEQAQAAMPGFQAAFDKLEKQLGEQGDLIQKSRREYQRTSKSRCCYC